MYWADYRKGAKKAKGQTGVMDRGYQSHKDFDLLQDENEHFIINSQAKHPAACRHLNRSVESLQFVGLNYR